MIIDKNQFDFQSFFDIIYVMKKVSKNKKTFEYSVVFEPAIEGGYNVSFPEFPGCVTFGETFEEAQQMAKEALSLWIESLKENKRQISKSQKYFSPIISRIAVKV